MKLKDFKLIFYTLLLILVKCLILCGAFSYFLLGVKGVLIAISFFFIFTVISIIVIEKEENQK